VGITAVARVPTVVNLTSATRVSKLGSGTPAVVSVCYVVSFFLFFGDNE
jgi:hypothetical protein